MQATTIKLLDRRLSAGSQLYPQLREQILTCVLRPRETISEIKIAETFGVSRTPVREAFKRLVDEGLLRVYPQVGTYVLPINLADVRDKQFVRETLECRTINMAVTNTTPADVDELRRLLGRQQEFVVRGDHQGFFSVDEAMHEYLIKMSGRPAVWRLIQDAKEHLDRVRHLSLEDRNWLQMVFDEHRNIVDAVAQHDALAAEAAMRVHLRTVLDAVERIARDHAEFFEDMP